MNAPMTKSEAIACHSVPALIAALRAELEPSIPNIPAELRAINGWLNYRVTQIDATTGKFNKIPIYPRAGQNRTGVQGCPDDMQNLGHFEDAIAALNTDSSLAGIGFALLPPFGIVALDADKCIEHGVLRPDVDELTEGTYCEVSPSGTGTRCSTPASWISCPSASSCVPRPRRGSPSAKPSS
jgi:primase-polymerase (primpol)-like protein